MLEGEPICLSCHLFMKHGCGRKSLVPSRCRLPHLDELAPSTTTSVRKPVRITTSVRNPTSQIRPIQDAANPSRLQFHMNTTCETTDRSINQLTNDLLEDLQNPTLGPLELCQLHNLTLPELAAILESESYLHAVECIERITIARDKLLEPQSKSLAKARLTDLLKTYPETEAQQETQRKAATTLLRSSSSSNQDHKPRSQSNGPVKPKSSVGIQRNIGEAPLRSQTKETPSDHTHPQTQAHLATPKPKPPSTKTIQPKTIKKNRHHRWHLLNHLSNALKKRISYFSTNPTKLSAADEPPAQARPREHPSRLVQAPESRGR